MKFFITLLILFFLLRLLMPYIIRWVLQAFVKRTLRKGGFTGTFGQPPFQQEPFQQQQQRTQEGKVNIDYVPDGDKAKSNGGDFKGGEYVDYEEVK
ncbi:DUF4834 domain-containing protein [Adhaeribacter arboris]|uniref:DUF4834 domain-containing protein n=1 Tax=Adhaeribacter arboris TaxID=2072846 RepID=A0A2T2YHV0_9BACT|nr:DUF4834 family protein [Adhaeribacter arboris]PSR55048.1 DUF4834 domain-containing protein [Adhaeribacter arboris]